MKILALDTSTEACTVAVLIDGEVLQRFALTPREHAQIILPMVEELLCEAQCELADLDALAVGCGPGSFVGVRIAVSVAQGLAFSAGIPVVPVSTLAALAQANPAAHVLVVQDARMNEVYSGAYQRNAMGYVQLIGIEQVLPPEALDLPIGEPSHWVGIGSGWSAYTESLAELSSRLRVEPAAIYPQASEIARLGAYGFSLGWAKPAREVWPVYLRDNVAKKSSE